MRCSECGFEEAAMKVCYWPAEGEAAEEWPLCDGCYAEVAAEVWIVPGPVFCFGTCRRCGEWVSVRELRDAKPSGRRSAPSGTCVDCAGEEA